MEWSVHIFILAVKDLDQQELDRMLEFLDNSVVVSGAKQVLEFSKYVFVFSWIKFHIFLRLQVLYLKE